MKRLLLLTLVGHLCAGLQAQSWQVLHDSAQVCMSQEQDWNKCAAILEQAVIVAKAEFGENDSSYYRTTSDLAFSYSHLKRLDEAQALIGPALLFAEEQFGTQHWYYQNRLRVQGQIYKAKGEYDAALAVFQESLKLIELHKNKGHYDYATTLNVIAEIYSELGQYQKALPLGLEAKELRKKNLGDKDMEYANSLNSLSTLYKNLGEYELAVQYMEETGEIVLENLGPDHMYYAFVLGNTASIYKRLQKYNEAAEKYEASLIILEKNVGKNHPYYGISLANVGSVYASLKQWDKGIEALEQAIAIFEQAYGKESQQYTNCLNNLGSLYYQAGQNDLALPLFEETHRQVEHKFGNQHPNYAHSLVYLGRVYLEMGRSEEGLALFQELFEVIKRQLATQYGTLNADLKQTYLQSSNLRYKLLHSLQFYYPDDPQLKGVGYDLELMFKGFLLNQSLDLQEGLRNHPDSTVQQSYQEWETLHKALSAELQKPIALRKANFDSLQNAANALEVKLASLSTDFLADRKQLSWKDVQQNLQPAEAAIEFVRFRLTKTRNSTDSTLYVAYLIRKQDSFPQMIPLFREQDFKAQNSQSSPAQLYAYRGIQPRQENSPASSHLTELIWAPLKEYLQHIQTVYYAPAGLLHRINLGAIPINENQVWSDQYSLIQLGSTRTLAFGSGEKNKHEEPSAMLFGGIQYDSDSIRPPSSEPVPLAGEDLLSIPLAHRGDQDQWQFLEGTQQEVQQIGYLLDQKGYAVQKLEGSHAREGQLKAITKSPRILHFATHGYFFPDPGQESEASANQVALAGSDHPMVRSGLILAGANHAWSGKEVPAGQEDGILTAYEISRMDLSHTELVVLSACETGLGDLQGNEGVYGLQRAFKIAGAKYILMSLWQVPDKETQELMTLFYQKWLNGMDIRAAFYDAQKEMRQKYPDPYLWAGFVLVE